MWRGVQQNEAVRESLTYYRERRVQQTGSLAAADGCSRLPAAVQPPELPSGAGADISPPAALTKQLCMRTCIACIRMHKRPDHLAAAHSTFSKRFSRD